MYRSMLDQVGGPGFSDKRTSEATIMRRRQDLRTVGGQP